MTTKLSENDIPYFSWDRKLSVAQIKEQLRNGKKQEWIRLAAWIMREAKFSDVWQFMTPQEVDKNLADLEILLGRKKKFWKYIIGAWHELGKL